MKYPHWLSVAISLLVVVIAWVVQQNSTGALVLPAVVISALSLIQPILAALSPSVVPSTNVKAALADASKKSVLPPLPLVVLCAACTMLVGCLSSAPTVPQTPDNAAQIASCESTAALHDGVMIGDFVVGGTGAALAGVAAAVSDPGQKTALAVGAAIAGGIGLAGTAVAGFSASNFANSHCSDVVGALPVSPFGKQHDAGAP